MHFFAQVKFPFAMHSLSDIYFLEDPRSVKKHTEPKNVPPQTTPLATLCNYYKPGEIED